MKPKALAHQPPRPAPHHRAADFARGHHAEPGGCLRGQRGPVGNQAAIDQPLTVAAHAGKITAGLELRGPPKTQALRCWSSPEGIHNVQNHGPTPTNTDSERTGEFHELTRMTCRCFVTIREIRVSSAVQRDYTGVKRLRPTRRRLRRVARPLLLELRFKKPCCRFRRILDG